MPCRNDYEGEDVARTKFELDKVTRLLCSAMDYIERIKHLGSMSLEHQEWIALHKENDRQRREDEARALASRESQVKWEIQRLQAQLDKLKKEIE